MWADTLLIIERGHLLRFGVWSATSVLVGLGLLFWLARRAERAPFIKQFAIQCLAWGVVELLFAVRGWMGLALRDYASATQFQQLVWLGAGLEIGYVAIGITLTLASLKSDRQSAASGAGAGIVVQGLALLVFHIRLLSLISPSR